MLAHIHTGAVQGVEGRLVRAEVNLTSGLPSFTVVGLAQGSVREGRERVAAALRNTGFGLPPRRITVNLAPAHSRKVGTAFDLPIAIGILTAAGVVEADAVRGTAFLGEVGLDGCLRPVSGVLPVALACRDIGLDSIVVPAENAAEAALAEGLCVLGASTLGEVVAHLAGTILLTPSESQWVTGFQFRGAELTGHRSATHRQRGLEDMSDVRGQGAAKRALEIAAAGGHNLLMMGPPGSGKSMLARRLSGILPPLTMEEALAVARVHSVAGLAGHAGLGNTRPFRAPHHSVSYAGLVGGGTPIRPGEISLAHHGVLFLDELPEYRRNVLEVLRQPLEEGEVTLARASGALRFPARFLLVAAMNPCPCGFAGDGTDRCLCQPEAVIRYRARVSGPLSDRIDLHVEVPALPAAAFEDGEGSVAVESSRIVAGRVRRAREVQTVRLAHTPGVHCNGQIPPSALRAVVRAERPALALLARAVERGGFSARARDRTLRVARTIADLGEREEVAVDDVAEAVQYRARAPAPVGRRGTERAGH